MRSGRVLRRLFGCGAVVALVVPVVLVATGGTAGAVTVSTEEELRTAFADGDETSIVLANDIVLDDCGAGVVQRTILGPPLPPLTLDGAGFTITQTCDDGVLRTEGDLTLVAVTITGGHQLAGSGGGVAAGDDGSPSLVVRSSTITGNRAEGGGSGGGIDWFASGSILIEDSTISDNFAGDTGGGLRSFGESVTLVRSTVSGNETEGDTGGGGGIDTGQGGPLTIVNSTVVGNSAQGEFGGGVVANSLSVVYSTVAGNRAAEGANLTLGADGNTFTPFASVVAQPLGGGENCFFFPSPNTASAGYNYSDDASCALTDPTDQEDAADPQLGELAANGGPTLTRLPAATSPLVDAVPVDACQDDGAAEVTTDQRGVARPQINGCDIGAVEIEPAPVPSIVLEPTFTG